jgi:hypothetical protein
MRHLGEVHKIKAECEGRVHLPLHAFNSDIIHRTLIKLVQMFWMTSFIEILFLSTAICPV